MHYLKKSLQTGKNYKISGKVGTFNKKLCFISPEIEFYDGNTVNTGRLVPIYPETAGVSLLVALVALVADAEKASNCFSAVTTPSVLTLATRLAVSAIKNLFENSV